MPKVVVVGSINMDLVTNAERIPVPGETVIGSDLMTFPGGKGANQAVAAARQGAFTTMIGHVGQDAFGRDLRGALAADGVDLRHVMDVEGASGVALIVVDAAGQNSIVVAPGANARVTPADVDAAEESIAGADVLLLQLEIPLKSVIRAAELGRKYHTTVILNPAPAQELPKKLLELVDLLIPNESECALLTGTTVAGADDWRAAATTLLNLGVGAAIITLGAEGALLAQPEGLRHFAPFRAKKVVDTTAAGDAFVGGLASALAHGYDRAAAIARAGAAGAIAVTRAGAQPSLPTRSEVEELLQAAGSDHLDGREFSG